jgi:hypothetical protein
VVCRCRTILSPFSIFDCVFSLWPMVGDGKMPIMEGRDFKKFLQGICTLSSQPYSSLTWLALVRCAVTTLRQSRVPCLRKGREPADGRFVALCAGNILAAGTAAVDVNPARHLPRAPAASSLSLRRPTAARLPYKAFFPPRETWQNGRRLGSASDSSCRTSCRASLGFNEERDLPKKRGGSRCFVLHQ